MIAFILSAVAIVGGALVIGYCLGYAVGSRDEARRVAEQLRKVREGWERERGV